MKSLQLLITLLGLILIASCGPADAGAIKLFEEQQSGWYEAGESQWTFEDGYLVGRASGESGFVMTKESYQDFELSLEFHPDSTVNSGVFVRCGKKELSHTDCYEMNIWDLHPDQKSRTGSVVSRAEPGAYIETLDKWNSYRIICDGDHIRTWVNGRLTIDIKNNDLINGYIALQAAETGTVKFRNVSLKPLGKP